MKWSYFDFMADMGEWFLSLTDKEFVRKPIKQWGWIFKGEIK